MTYSPEEFGRRSRDGFVRALQAEGIPCTAGYVRPLSDEGGLHAAAEGYPNLISTYQCPIPELICDHSVWLLQYMLLGNQRDLDGIIEAIAETQKAFRLSAAE